MDEAEEPLMPPFDPPDPYAEDKAKAIAEAAILEDRGAAALEVSEQLGISVDLARRLAGLPPIESV